MHSRTGSGMHEYTRSRFAIAAALAALVASAFAADGQAVSAGSNAAGSTVIAVASRATAASPPAPAIVTGQDAGWPDVRGWDRLGNPAQAFGPWGEFPLAFSPYPTYQNGVRVAVGDVDGDGRPEIVTAPGRSGFTELRVFDGRSFHQVGSLLPFKDAAWWAGAFIALGDTSGDGRAEVVEGLDAGCCTTLHVLDPVSGNELSGFFPYGERSEVGARVAAGDVNGDGRAEILAVPLRSTRISAYAPSGGAAFRSFDAFGSEATAGASIAAGDLIGDPRAEVVAAAPTSSGPQVKIFDVASGKALASFFPYSATQVSSLELALGDIDGDHGLDVVLSATTGDGTLVKAIDVTGRDLASFYVVDPGIAPAASVAAGDLDEDGKAEIVLGGGPTNAPWPPVAGGPDQRVAIYRADGTTAGGFTAYPGLFQGGVRVASADVDGDHRPEIVTAPGPGLESEIGVFTQEFVNGRDRGMRLAHFLAFEPTFGCGASIAAGDVSGDRNAEIVVASGPGRRAEVRVFDAGGRLLSSVLPFEPAYEGGLSVAVGDLNADGKAEIVVGTLAAPARIRAFSQGAPYGPVTAPFAGNGRGVEVSVADLAGTGRGVILAGAATGAHPTLALLDPWSGAVTRSFEPGVGGENGLRLAAGDLDGDGRDEIVVSPGWGGDGVVRIFDRRFVQIRSFAPYPWPGWGMNVALPARIGLPIAAEPHTVRLVAGKRKTVIVGRFRDAAGAGSSKGLRASIDWGDGTSARGTVRSRGNGIYDVRGSKRYARAGRYVLIVQMTDDHGRSSIARGTAIVTRHR